MTAEIKKGKIAASVTAYTGEYDGQPHGITVTVTAPAEGATVKYGTAEGTYDLDVSPTILEVGTITVYFRITAENYDDYTGSATVTIAEKTNTAVVTAAPAAKDLTYTGTAQELVSAGTAIGGTIQYAPGVNSTTAPAEGWTTAIPTGTNAGTYYIWYKAVGDEEHTDSEAACVSAEIKKAAATVTTDPAAIPGLVSTGAPQALITAGTATGGEMQYALGADTVTAPATGWSKAIPAGTDAGTYFVWYKAVGDANHNDSAAACITVTIGEKVIIDLSGAKIGKIKDQTYTGSKITPKLKVVLNGVELVQDVDYTVQFKHNWKIGNATVKVIGINGYKGETKKTFRIVPKPVKDKKIKVQKDGNHLIVSWGKNGKNYDGFEIQISTNKNFKKGAATRLIGIYEKEKTGYTITNLAPGKTYYVRVRSYKKVKVGKKTVKFNSEWSGTVKKTLK